MRIQLKKIVLAATFELALASNATAQTYNGPVTQIDDFANGNFYAITGESWYNYTVASGNGTVSISNGGEGEVVNPAGYAELKDISLQIPTWNDWAQTAIGLDAKNNGVLYDLAQCSEGFQYTYKGNGHRFILQDKNNSTIYYSIIDIEDRTNGGSSGSNAWKLVTIKPDNTKLNDAKAIQWLVRPESDYSKSITSYLQIKDFICLGALDLTSEGITCIKNGKLWENGVCKEAPTPTHLSQTPGKWNILAHTVSNAIILQNLPKNAKIDVYNLQGKQVYSAHPGNPKILRIGVQTKGMYIVKISSGSEAKTLRIMVR
jgi:hypothetical protein